MCSDDIIHTLSPLIGENWLGIRYFKIGTKVTLSVSVKNVQVNTDLNGIAMLPPGYRPAFEVLGRGIGGSLANNSVISARPDGNISGRSDNSYIYANVTFDAFN